MMAQAATEFVSATAAESPDSTRELLLALHRKVDALGAQVEHLYERTRAIEELKDELVHVARDAMGALQVELSGIEHEFNTDEIVHLLRQLLRGTPRFIRLLERLESVDELLHESGPLGKEVMRDLVERMQRWEQQGYFELARQLAQAVDRVAEHAGTDRLQWLAERVVPVLELAEQAMRPEVLEKAQGAVQTLARVNGDSPRPVGLWGAMRATRDPEVRQGLGVLFEILRQLGAQPSSEYPALPAAPDSNPRLTEGEKE